LTASGSVKREQRLDLLIGGGPPVSAARQRRENLSRAGRLVGETGGAANENLPSPRRLSHTLGVIWTADGETGDARLTALVLREIVHRHPWLKRTFGARSLLDKRRADHVR